MPASPIMRKVENLAMADRETIGCRFGESCDPRLLVKIYDLSIILETKSDYNLFYDRETSPTFPAEWSGVTLRLPNFNHLMLINLNHAKIRRTFTIAHEFGHLVYCHQPTKIALDASPNEYAVRFDQKQEFEAFVYGMSILLPYAPLLQMLQQKASIIGIANHYGVSKSAVEFRMKVSGLWGLQF